MSFTTTISNWSVLGLLLGLTNKALDECQRTENPHKAIITKWLQHGNASWANLVTALKDKLVDQIAVADCIAKSNPIIPKSHGNYVSIIIIIINVRSP